jgi:sensor histidine kinase YesM
MSALVAHDERIPFFFAFITNIVLFGIAAILSLPVLRFGNWLAGRRRNPFFTIPVVVASCILYAALWMWTSGILFSSVYGPYFTKNIFEPISVWTFLNGVVICGVIFGVAYARHYSQNLHEAELNRAKLQYLAKESELRMLRSQIKPHFLFNALNSVYAMIESDPREAREMLVKLSELLRSSLSAADKEFMTLKEDCEFARRYLDIEKVRLGDRLIVKTEVDEGALSTTVPSLILQPLVENAIKHGASRTALPVTVTISARRRGDTLELVVSDTGAGMDPQADQAAEGGYGLLNLRARLDSVYGDGYKLICTNEVTGGFEVRIELPLGGDPSAAVIEGVRGTTPDNDSTRRKGEV